MRALPVHHLHPACSSCSSAQLNREQDFTKHTLIEQLNKEQVFTKQTWLKQLNRELAFSKPAELGTAAHTHKVFTKQTELGTSEQGTGFQTTYLDGTTEQGVGFQKTDFKDSPTKFLTSSFFYNSNLPGPLTGLKYFRFWLRFRWIIRILVFRFFIQ